MSIDFLLLLTLDLVTVSTSLRYLPLKTIFLFGNYSYKLIKETTLSFLKDRLSYYFRNNVIT
jgi:hypothetical protein